MNTIQQIAKKRLEEIEHSTARILRKIELNPHKEAAYRNRLAEYEVSKKALEIELKSGVAVKIKDKAQMALINAMSDGDPIPESFSGTVVNVPAGAVNMEGK